MIFPLLALLSFPSPSSAYQPLGRVVQENLRVDINAASVSCQATTDQGYPKDLEVLHVELSVSPENTRFVHHKAQQTSYDALHNKPCAALRAEVLAAAAKEQGHIDASVILSSYANAATGELPDGRTMIELIEYARIALLPAELEVVAYADVSLPEDDVRVVPENPLYSPYYKTAHTQILVDLSGLTCRVQDIHELGGRFRVVLLKREGGIQFARIAHPTYQLVTEMPEGTTEEAACAPVKALVKQGVITVPVTILAYASNEQDDSIEIFEDSKLTLPGLDPLNSLEIERLSFRDERTH